MAVTSNVTQLGATYAYIDGYVNLNLITSSYSSQRIGVELSMKEEFTSTRRAESKSLEGNKLTIVIDTLSAQTKYYYRTFVKINDLYYYGEKRSFTTKDFNNITTTGDVINLTYTMAKVTSKVDLTSVPEKENYRIGIVYSANKDDLQSVTFSSYAYDDVPVSVYDTTPVTGPVAITSSLYDIKNNMFEITLSRLQVGTTYYYCSFTRAGSKAKFGEIKSFKTTTLSPQDFSTGEAKDITLNSAIIENVSLLTEKYPQGTQISYGLILSSSKDVLTSHIILPRYVLYSKDDNEYIYYDPITYKYIHASELVYSFNNAIVNGNKFTVQLQKLSPGTTYYYYAYAFVPGAFLESEIKSFTTKAITDYLKTDDATDVTYNSATITGNTTLPSAFQQTPYIQYELRYSTIKENLDQNSYNYQSRTLLLNQEQLQATLTNLSAETTYYYCIVAYVDGESYYGETKSFKTKRFEDCLTGNGTATNPYNVKSAILIAQHTGNNESDRDIYIKGFLVKYAQNGEYETNYGNASFYISDDGKENSELFYVFRTFYFENQKYTSGIKPQPGDEVVVCGRVTYYKGSTPETVGGKSFLYSINGMTK